jgi:hypothetical protein
MYKTIIFVGLMVVTAWADVDSPCPGFETGDAIYRLVRVAGMYNQHAAMFEGMFTDNTNWYVPVIEVLGSSGACPTGNDIYSAQRNNQGYWVAFKPISHNPADIDQLRMRFKDAFKKGDASLNYKGSFTSMEGLTSGIIGPYERNSIQNSAYQVYLNVDAGYTFNDIMERDDPSFHYCCWYTDPPHDIYHIKNIRCDFIPEWSYECLGFKVWGSCQAPSSWNLSSSYNNSNRHNDAYAGSYECAELFPEIQNGTKNENGNDSKYYTTFRPSPVEAPDVFYVGLWCGQFNLYGMENGNSILFAALEYSNDGINWGWVQDNNGITWKYNQLWCPPNNHLSNNYCGTSILCKRSSFDFYFPVDPWTKYNARFVRATLLDQGTNYFTKILDKNLGQHINNQGIWKSCN